MTNSMDNELNEQSNNKPWLFKKGQSGNPNGRPKGTFSLKTYAKKYLEEMTDEEKLEFMDGLPKEIIWKMAEGNPQNQTELTGDLMLRTDPEKRKEVENALNDIIPTN